MTEPKQYQPLSEADAAAVEAQLERPARGVAGGGLALSVRETGRDRDRTPAARRYAVPDHLLSDLSPRATSRSPPWSVGG